VAQPRRHARDRTGPGDRLMSHAATKKASQVSSVMVCSGTRHPFYAAVPSIERAAERAQADRADNHHDAMIGHTSGHVSARPLPFSAGADDAQEVRERQHLASACAPTGHARNGNMNPDSRIDGRKKNTVICIDCSWFAATVEKVSPSVSSPR